MSKNVDAFDAWIRSMFVDLNTATRKQPPNDVPARELASRPALLASDRGRSGPDGSMIGSIPGARWQILQGDQNAKAVIAGLCRAL
jgi:hypothetical protein